MKKTATVILCLVMSWTAVSAQNTQTSFMLENHVYGYRFNPAFIPEKSFFSIGDGNINPTVQSGIGLSGLVFPTDDGRLVTGFNSAVPAKDFLGGLQRKTPLNVDVHENILAIGFRGRNGGYSTIELNARAGASVTLPYDAFAFLKEAGTGIYDLGDFAFGANGYAELAYGFSKAFGERFNFGFRTKVLVGAANVALDVSKACILLDGDRIAVSADVRMDAACTCMEPATKESEHDESCDDVLDFSSFTYDLRKLRPSGYGAAVDIGFMVEPVRGLELHLAVCDLGIMAWNCNVSGQTDADLAYSGGQALEDGAGSELGKELEEALAMLESLAEFHKVEAVGFRYGMIPFRLNAALKYRMPFWRRLAAGAMATYRHTGIVDSYDVRAGLSMTPGNWFSITGNAGYSSFGPVCGAGFSMNAGPLCLFTTVDGYIGRIGTWAPDPSRPKLAVPYPVNRFNYSLSAGFLIQFGKRAASKYDRYPEVDSR